MSQELSRQEIWEIKRVSSELGERILLNEEIKVALSQMINDWGKLGFLGTSPQKLIQFMKKLKQSEQFLKSLGGIQDPKLLAQTIESILVLLKINNQDFDIVKTVTLLKNELSRDKKYIDELLKRMKEKKTKELELKQKRQQQNQMQTGQTRSGFTSTARPGIASATRSSFARMPIREEKNYLSEMVARKVLNKLVLK